MLDVRVSDVDAARLDLHRLRAGVGLPEGGPVTVRVTCGQARQRLLHACALQRAVSTPRGASQRDVAPHARTQHLVETGVECRLNGEVVALRAVTAVGGGEHEALHVRPPLGRRRMLHRLLRGSVQLRRVDDRPAPAGDRLRSAPLPEEGEEHERHHLDPHGGPFHASIHGVPPVSLTRRHFARERLPYTILKKLSRGYKRLSKNR